MAEANMAHSAFKPRILAVTWNTAGRLTKQSLADWTDVRNLDAGAWRLWVQRAVRDDIPDIVILSLQEWNLSNAFPKAFGVWLNEFVPGGYHVSATTLKNSAILRKLGRDFSQRLVVFVRTQHVPVMMLTKSRKKRKADKQRIKEAKAAYEAELEFERDMDPGFYESDFRKVHPDPALELPEDLNSMPHLVKKICHGSNKVCTKSSIVVRMYLNGKPLYIVSSHFPFRGQNNIEVRNRAYHEVIHKVPDLAYDPAALVIWLGDLNYRMQYREQDDKYFDQLRQVIADRDAFDGYQEGPEDQGPFGFNPTCKMIVLPEGNVLGRRMAFHKARLRATPQAYDPRRIESWCDRVLWHQGLNYHGDPQLEVVSYRQATIDGSLHSDHTAVAAVLQYV